jgi:hypothetical protein
MSLDEIDSSWTVVTTVHKFRCIKVSFSGEWVQWHLPRSATGLTLKGCPGPPGLEKEDLGEKWPTQVILETSINPLLSD